MLYAIAVGQIIVYTLVICHKVASSEVHYYYEIINTNSSHQTTTNCHAEDYHLAMGRGQNF